MIPGMILNLNKIIIIKLHSLQLEFISDLQIISSYLTIDLLKFYQKLNKNNKSGMNPYL